MILRRLASSYSPNFKLPLATQQLLDRPSTLPQLQSRDCPKTEKRCSRMIVLLKAGGLLSLAEGANGYVLGFLEKCRGHVFFSDLPIGLRFD